MMEKQVCSMVHETYAGQKGEFFVEKARTFFHPVTDFIPKGFNRRAFPKEVQKSFRAFLTETAFIIKFDSNFKKEKVPCQFSMQKFKLKYT